jgi:hypothetical protein
VGLGEDDPTIIEVQPKSRSDIATSQARRRHDVTAQQFADGVVEPDAIHDLHGGATPIACTS